jgi:D-cysteine desulfhydrase
MNRISLAHLPTPLQHAPRLGAEIGVDLWVKRDDATGGAEAGNKIRKLELLLGDAVARGSDTLLTCGGIQSNHARATALLGAQLGLRTVLWLRVPGLTDDDGGRGLAPNEALAPRVGNVLLDLMAGAELRLITPASYARRAEVLAEGARELASRGAKPYVIPEGGSNGLGALGYVGAMAEIRAQLDRGIGGGGRFDWVVHACGSGGTAAGVALGTSAHSVADRVVAMAVCEDAQRFEPRIRAIIAEARGLDATLGEPARWSVDDREKGPAYAVATPEQLRRIVRATRVSGLVFDPVYTGKALCGLWSASERGEARGARVLFVHTGGLPGLLAQSAELGPLLEPDGEKGSAP